MPDRENYWKKSDERVEQLRRGPLSKAVTVKRSYKYE